MKNLISKFVSLFVNEAKEKLVTVSSGKQVQYGSKEHEDDLNLRIRDLEMWRNLQRKGSENRANYSRIISKLKADLRSIQNLKTRV